MSSTTNSFFVPAPVPNSREFAFAYFNRAPERSIGDIGTAFIDFTISKISQLVTSSKAQSSDDKQESIIAWVTTQSVINVLNTAVYGVLRFSGYDFGCITLPNLGKPDQSTSYKISNFTPLFAPRYILSKAVLQVLNTVSTRYLIALNVSIFAVSYFAAIMTKPVKQQETDEVDSEVFEKLVNDLQTEYKKLKNDKDLTTVDSNDMDSPVIESDNEGYSVQIKELAKNIFEESSSTVSIKINDHDSLVKKKTLERLKKFELECSEKLAKLFKLKLDRSDRDDFGFLKIQLLCNVFVDKFPEKKSLFEEEKLDKPVRQALMNFLLCEFKEKLVNAFYQIVPVSVPEENLPLRVYAQNFERLFETRLSNKSWVVGNIALITFGLYNGVKILGGESSNSKVD